MAEPQASVSAVPNDNPTVAKIEDPPVGTDPTDEVKVETVVLHDAMTDIPASPKRPSADSGVTKRVVPSVPATTEAAPTAAVEEAGASATTSSTPHKKIGFFSRIRKTFSPMTKMLKIPHPVIDEPVTESTSEGTSLEPASPLVHLSDQDEQAGPSTSFELPQVQPASDSSVKPAQEDIEESIPAETGASVSLTQQSPARLGFFNRLRQSMRMITRRRSEDPPVAASATSPDEVVPVKLSKQDRIKKLQESTVFKESVDSVGSQSTESEMLTSAPITPGPLSPPPERKISEDQAKEAAEETDQAKEAVGKEADKETDQAKEVEDKEAAQETDRAKVEDKEAAQETDRAKVEDKEAAQETDRAKEAAKTNPAKEVEAPTDPPADSKDS